MNRARHRAVGCRARPGAAMVEFVLCIPLLATLLALTFLIGWAMGNQQRVRIADRYTAWRLVRGGALPTGDELNREFLFNRARSVAVSVGGGPEQTLQHFVDAADSYDRRAGQLADTLVLNDFPRQIHASVTGDFPSDVSLWQRFAGTIRSRHSRQGVEWRCGQARMEQPVVEEFLSSVDGMLQGTPSPADRLAQMFRRLYLNTWGRAVP